MKFEFVSRHLGIIYIQCIKSVILKKVRGKPLYQPNYEKLYHRDMPRILYSDNLL